MRKNLYLGLIACAALTMTGCSNDEVSYDSPKQEDQPIQFSTYLGKNVQGRGTINNDDALQTSGFGVTAFYTGQTTWTGPIKAPDFMYNQKVTYSTSWTYDPVKYWPTKAGDKISFFAYAPYATVTNGITLNGKEATTTATQINFSIATAANQMIDFVAAQVINATQQDDASGGNGDRSAVSFNFKHELSRLAFKVKTSKNLNSESHLVLKTVELVASDAYTQTAVYTFNNASTAEDVSTRGSWDTKTPISTDYSLSTIINYGSATTIGGKNYSGISTMDVTSTTATDLFKSGEYLFLIPATNASGTGLSANTAAVKFTYDIVTEDNKLEEGYSCTSAEKIVYLPANILKQGVAYNVTFTFAVDDIEVSGTVSDWGSETSESTNVPFTPDTATAD